MIKKLTCLSLVEMREILKKIEGDTARALEDFIKKLTKISLSEYEKLKDNLTKLDIAKLKEEDIVNLIDLMPEDPEDIRKILVGISLNQDETNKILQVIKKK